MLGDEPNSETQDLFGVESQAEEPEWVAPAMKTDKQIKARLDELVRMAVMLDSHDADVASRELQWVLGIKPIPGTPTPFGMP